MRIIVSGDDEVGLTVAESLMHAHGVVLIAPVGFDAPRLDRLDIEVIGGRATAREVLRSAGADRCAAFIACTDNDELNIVSCLAARALGTEKTICMLGRPGFFDAKDDDRSMAKALGVDLVVRPWDRLAREILRVITVPGALDVELLARNQVALLRSAVEEDAPITGYPIKQYLLPADATLVGLRRGEELSIPTGDTHLRAGDKLTVMGTPKAVQDLLHNHLRAPIPHNDKKSVIIVGGGVVGFLVARGLEERGWQIKLVEIDRDRCEELASRLPKTLVLHGDGSDMDLLEEEQVDAAAVLVAVTDNDEKNLLVSMLAKTLGVPRIVTRAGRLINERLFERVGVDIVRSARGAAVRAIIEAAVETKQAIRAELEHGDVHVVELELPEGYPPTALRDIHTNLFAIVGAVVRGTVVEIARGDTEVRAGDHLFLFCTQEDEDKTLELFLTTPPTPKNAEA